MTIIFSRAFNYMIASDVLDVHLDTVHLFYRFHLIRCSGDILRMKFYVNLSSLEGMNI